jgi:hypothetical protein
MKNSTEILRNMPNAHFLRSAVSGEDFTGTPSEQVSFSNYLKKYEKGQLMPNTGKKRNRTSPFHVLEDKLVKYIRLRQSLCQLDKGEGGLSWVLLQTKLLEWAALEDDPVYRTFAASPGFIGRVLRDHNLTLGSPTPDDKDSGHLASQHQKEPYPHIKCANDTQTLICSVSGRQD